VLSKKYKTAATVGNLNNHIGVPLTLLSIKPGTEIALIEMGANHQHEIAFYCEITMPNYGLITNCGKAHLEGFGGIEGVKKGKGELYDFLRTTEGSIFRNADLDYLAIMAHDIPEQITYGTANAKIIGRNLHSDPFLKVAVLSSGLETEIRTQLAGHYNLPNVLAAVAVGNYFNVPMEDIKNAIESYIPDNSRSQWLEKGTNKIILDAYNANPSSMQLAIQNLKETKGTNKWLIIGGMKELGTESQIEHQAIIDFARQSGFTNVLLCGSEFEHTAHESYPWFSDAAQLRAWLHNNPIQNALILIKGSRSTGMEVVLEAF
jgi:UDP-N-acetylmuramoyl-tripeptide--D-alanyl-D-alanine ligase